ncbi:MAG: hypothetical protein AABX51_00595 [Nanoarchaeota archaeon]
MNPKDIMIFGAIAIIIFIALIIAIAISPFTLKLFLSPLNRTP